MRPDETPIRPRLRNDLEWVGRVIRGHQRWIARDPLNLEFYYFSARERRFLIGLDGARTAPQICGDATQDPVGAKWRSSVLDRALRCQLVLAAMPGRARRLSRIQEREQDRRRRFSLLNLIAIRVPLFDPHWILLRLRSIASLVYSKSVLAILAAITLATIASSVARWDEIAARVPDLQNIFTGDRIVWLVVCYVLMKLAHEASHALACARFGAECHEIGIYFLAFTPCLYCDVSDVWRLPSKTARIMVSAAGIWAEVTIATLAALVWLATHDGFLNSLCFNLMLLGSVSTLLVNANPLLRFDGYYILADLVDVPNLRQQGGEALFNPLMRWLSDGRISPTPRDAPWLPLAAYGLAALIYRLFVIGLILWGTNRLFANWNLEFAWIILAVSIVSGMTLAVAMQLLHGIRQLVMFGIRPWIKLAALVCVLGSLTAYGLTRPLPGWIQTVAVMQPERMEPVFVLRTGALTQFLAPGQSVRKGDLIAEFDSPEDRMQLHLLESEIGELLVEQSGVIARINDEPELAARAAELEIALRDKKKRQQSIQKDIDQLKVYASAAGTIFEPTWSRANSVDASQLERWSGNPLCSANLGGLFEQGTLLGWIVPEGSWRFDGYVPESEVTRILEDSTVEIQLDRDPFQTLSGRVVRIDAQPLEQLPPLLSGDNRLPISAGFGESALTEMCYRVTMEGGTLPDHISLRTLGTVRIKVQPRSILQRIKAYLSRHLRG